MTYEIPTDLITPLGAYLALRDRGNSTFLLESVERGRLGRHSLVGCGTHTCTFEEAETAGAAVVGYLAYDHVTRLEPTVPLPAAGSELPESRFIVAEVLVRFDHALGVAEVLAGAPADVGSLRRPRASAGLFGRTAQASFALRRRTSTRRTSAARSSTSATAMRSRSSCPSAQTARHRRPRSTSTVRSGA